MLLLRFMLIAAIGLMSTASHSQDFDDPDTRYSTGAVLPSDEEKAEIPPPPQTRAFLPEIVDLSSRMPPVGNQGALGSCVSWAVGYAARSYYSKLQHQGSLPRASIPSPAYMHGLLRQADGKGRCTGGAYVIQALDLLESDGAASLAEMPYNDRRCDKPPESLIEKVRNNRQFATEPRWATWSGFFSIKERANLDAMKRELANGHPIVISIRLDDAFHRLRGRKVWSGLGNPDSGHAVTLVGYNERGQYFKFINSWGTGWGDRGYGRISYQTMIDQEVLGHSIRVAGVEPPEPEPDPDGPIAPRPDDIALPQVSCGKLSQGRVDGNHVIRGFVREEADLAKIREAVGSRDVKLEVDLRPWPQCEALMTLSEPLDDNGKPAVELPQQSYREGDTLSFSVGMAPFEGYLHVAYVQADGNVVNLVQQGVSSINTLPRGAKLIFGDGQEGRPQFVVSEPFGEEMVIAIASASPLFDAPRPTVEVEREFLTALRQAILARPDPNLPQRRISAQYAILKTQGESP